MDTTITPKVGNRVRLITNGGYALHVARPGDLGVVTPVSPDHDTIVFVQLEGQKNPLPFWLGTEVELVDAEEQLELLDIPSLIPETPETPKTPDVLPSVEGGMASDGGPTSYYDFPAGANTLNDVIEDKNMSFAQGNILKAAMRLGKKGGATRSYDLKKIIYYANRMLAVENGVPYGERDKS